MTDTPRAAVVMAVLDEAENIEAACAEAILALGPILPLVMSHRVV